jgi:hypothetical protein
VIGLAMIDLKMIGLTVIDLAVIGRMSLSLQQSDNPTKHPRHPFEMETSNRKFI